MESAITDIAYYRSHSEHNGIANVGNSCYMSAGLQLIVHCYEMIYRICALNISSADIPALTQHIYGFIRAYWLNSNVQLNPQAIRVEVAKLSPSLATAEQQDSAEWLNFVLDMMSEQTARTVRFRIEGQADTPEARLMVRSLEHWRDTYSHKYSYVVRYLAGQYYTTIECNHCHTLSDKFEPFLTIPVDIPEDERVDTLQGVIDHYSRPEQVEVYEKVCNVCGADDNHRTKINYFTRLPKYMIINLKRYRYVMGAGGYQAQKIHRRLTIPSLVTDESVSFAANTMGYERFNAEYRITGAILHQGGAPNSGHYSCVMKKLGSGQWKLYDDQNVGNITVEHAQRMIEDIGYILLLDRVSLPTYEDVNDGKPH